MDTYDYIEATLEFLELFDLYFEYNKVGNLKRKMNSFTYLDIYDSSKNVVGRFSYNENNYTILAMLEDKIISAKVSKNKKRKAAIEFKYDVKLISNDLRLTGEYEKIKKGSRYYKYNSYCIFIKDKFICKCSFDPIRRNYYIYYFNQCSNWNKFEFDNNTFNLSTEEYVINIKKMMDTIYFEKIFDVREAHDVFGGYELDFRENSFPLEIVKILENLTDDYYEFFNIPRDLSNEIMPNLFDKVIDKSIDDKHVLDNKYLFRKEKSFVKQKVNKSNKKSL